MKINNEVKIIIGIVIVCVVLIGLFLQFAPRNGGAQVVSDLSLLIRESSHMTGKKEAKVTLVNFGDYQCPACAAVNPFIKEIIQPYKDNPDFNFVYRNYPLPQHANALSAAEAAEAAGAQGKYFEMGELLYKNQKEWEGLSNPIDIYVNYARSLGLDILKFRSEIEEKQYEGLILVDLKDANTIGLTHTPTFFLNGVEVVDLSKLKDSIDKALAQ